MIETSLSILAGISMIVLVVWMIDMLQGDEDG